MTIKVQMITAQIKNPNDQLGFQFVERLMVNPFGIISKPSNEIPDTDIINNWDLVPNVFVGFTNINTNTKTNTSEKQIK